MASTPAGGLAGYVGYEVAGIGGAFIAVAATVIPTLLLMLGALGLLYRHRDSPRVKRMSQWVRPVIAMMMAWLTLGFMLESLNTSGALHTAIIGIVAAIALIRFNTHPAFVVIGALIYGGLIIP